MRVHLVCYIIDVGEQNSSNQDDSEKNTHIIT